MMETRSNMPRPVGSADAKLAEGGHLQLDLFDERNLISLTHEDYPGERLIACRNPALAKLRAEKRQDLIAATTRELDKVAAMVTGGRLKGAEMKAAAALADHLKVSVEEAVSDAIVERMVSAGLAKVKPAEKRGG